ncbi:MAG: hypothetical protein JSV36_05615 [Anaerolineae bacterium]|nr:MAG: hypothetical protein JSV36_05615 [Anaerolineae bacterium]
MGVKVRLIEGAPVTVGEKRLTPVVRAISWYRRGATVRQGGSSGFGAMAVWLQPVAVLEETPDGRRRIPIYDQTGRALLGWALVALAVPVVLSLLLRFLEARD